jgi:hypothetical protein
VTVVVRLAPRWEWKALALFTHTDLVGPARRKIRVTGYPASHACGFGALVRHRTCSYVAFRFGCGGAACAAAGVESAGSFHSLGPIRSGTPEDPRSGLSGVSRVLLRGLGETPDTHWGVFRWGIGETPDMLLRRIPVWHWWGGLRRELHSKSRGWYQPSQRSLHSGFRSLIIFSFQARRQRLIRFSMAIASVMVW